MQRKALLQAEDQREADAQQYYTYAHRRGDAKYGANQRNDADAVTQGAAHALAQQWVEGRPNRQGHVPPVGKIPRSEEHTSELQSLMRISYAVFCLKKKNIQQK